jgi:DNA modification methylase
MNLLDMQVRTDWEIRTGDCLEELARFDDKARLIFADPPYNIGVDYGLGKSADKLPYKKYLAWVESWLEACRDALTTDGSLWVLINDEYAAEYCVILKQLGLTLRSWIKWYESFGVNCNNKFNRCSRHLFYFVRDANDFVFHKSAVTRPSARQTVYNDKRAAAGGKLWDNVWGLDPAIPRLTGTCKERIPGFPTQLPLKLLTPIILCASNPGDLVIDPFNGSGTTGVAAIKHGRRYLGIEKSEQFAIWATERLKGLSHG